MLHMKISWHMHTISKNTKIRNFLDPSCTVIIKSGKKENAAAYSRL